MATAQRASLLERRAEELRLDIAAAAMSIFVSDGDTSATVERIAEAAGVAPRTFYRHFAVKEDVVLPLFRRSSQNIADAVRAISPDQDLVDGLVEAFRTELHGERLSTEQRDFLGLLMGNPQYRMRWIEVDGSLREAIADLLGARVSLNEDPFVHRLAAELLAHTARRAFEEWLGGHTADSIDDLLRRGFDVVLTGVRGSVPGPTR